MTCQRQVSSVKTGPHLQPGWLRHRERPASASHLRAGPVHRSRQSQRKSSEHPSAFRYWPQKSTSSQRDEPRTQLALESHSASSKLAHSGASNHTHSEDMSQPMSQQLSSSRPSQAAIVPVQTSSGAAGADDAGVPRSLPFDESKRHPGTRSSSATAPIRKPMRQQMQFTCRQHFNSYRWRGVAPTTQNPDIPIMGERFRVRSFSSVLRNGHDGQRFGSLGLRLPTTCHTSCCQHGQLPLRSAEIRPS